MSLSVVTTLSESNWMDYGNRSIPTWLGNFDSDVKFYFYTNFRPVEDPRITYINDSLEKKVFLERNYQIGRELKNKTESKYMSRWDTYCHKVFAQCEASQICSTDFMVFLDSDIAVLDRITTDDIKNMLDTNFCGYVGRDKEGTETGLILYDLRHDSSQLFFKNFLDYYVEDKIFDLKQWDDCYVFDCCRKESSLPFKNLSGKYSTFIDPISVSELGNYFDHWMGKLSKLRGYSKHRKFRGRI